MALLHSRAPNLACPPALPMEIVLVVLVVFSALVVAFLAIAQSGDPPAPGKAAPDFRLPDLEGHEHSPASFAGQRAVYFFHPQDETPECIEALERLKACAAEVEAAGAALSAVVVSTRDSADAYAIREGLDLPEEPEARNIDADPACVTNPILELNLGKSGITSIVWATGYALDFGWLKVGAFDEKGRPAHRDGVSVVPGLYFLGLAWLSRRASPFIWGVWHDAKYLAEHIAERRSSRAAG